MSVDIHFAAYVSVSEIASSGSPRDARNPFTSATRRASEASSEAASAWPAGITKPLPMAAIARIVLTNLRKAHLPRVSATDQAWACLYALRTHGRRRYTQERVGRRSRYLTVTSAGRADTGWKRR